MKEKAVVVFSGGLDSTTVLYKAISEGLDVYPITFKYGQKHSKEILCAIDIASNLDLKHKLVDISFFGNIAPSALTSKEVGIPKGHYASESMKQTVVPNRNMVFLSIATSYAIGLGANSVWYGAHSGDHAIYPDCRPEFVEVIKEAIQLCDYKPPVLQVPYLNLNKTDIVSEGLRLRVPYEKTWTCYEGGERPCRKCGSCVERIESFSKNGVKDPLVYKE